MGLFSFLDSIFKSGHNDMQPEEPAPAQSPTNISHIVPYTTDLIYPATLPHFDEIAEGGHSDQRAVICTILRLDTKRERVFYDKKLRALDFGEGEKAYQILLEKGLIREPTQDKVLASLYTQDELKGLLRERGLRVKGSKRELAERLIGSGFHVDGNNYPHRLFELTENGIKAIEEYRSDEKQAIFLAISALKEMNFPRAISAYRGFDSKWGFVHTSGKEHTIFANYNIPFGRFEFIAHYSMPELNNSDNFKNTLRACIMAGTMSDHRERWEIANFFEAVCHEQIRCPNIVDYFRADDSCYMEFRESTLAAMQRNIEADNRYVLEYYISRIKFLSKQSI